ncbi:MAG TPA: hypothetical protein VG621_03270 [Candidatus Paceibacterota bacterium]|nr:hypothetical protein [Candidatus Paceibacterota bacterium]
MSTFDLSVYEDKNIFLERVFALRFKQAILRSVKLPNENLLKKVANERVYRMTEREPVHYKKKFFGIIKNGRNMYWPKIGLLTHHEPESKRAILARAKFTLGESRYALQLINATDLNYYNRGGRKITYNVGGKKIGYGD